MARDEAPPFERGGTYYRGGAIDASNLGGVNLEGKEWRFEDNAYGTGMFVHVRVVRNAAAAALLPKRLVTFQATFFGMRVDGYATTNFAAAYPVDEFLPTAGVPVGDLFYIVTRGPCLVKNDIASGAGTVINAGDPLVALTAATSGATTAGRVYAGVGTGATTNTGNQLNNIIGYAASAKTTGNTNADVLVVVRQWL
jgi:hypothetical protein